MAPRTRRVRHFGIGAAGLFAVVSVAVLLAPSVSAAPTAPFHPALIQNGGSTSGVGSLTYCGPGLTSADSGYVCEEAAVAGGVGYARGWDQLQANSQALGLSGRHSFYLLGALNLSAGFATAEIRCPPGGSANGAYALVYVFWHVWVYDVTNGAYATQSNSGYIWLGGTGSCPSAGGNVTVTSPALRGAFNSSGYLSTGPTGFTFNGSHRYVFTGFLGCTAEASVYSVATRAASAGAFCNAPTTKASNVFTISSIAV